MLEARRHPSKDAAFDLAKGEWFDSSKLKRICDGDGSRAQSGILTFRSNRVHRTLDASHQFLMISIAEMRRQSLTDLLQIIDYFCFLAD